MGIAMHLDLEFDGVEQQYLGFGVSRRVRAAGATALAASAERFVHDLLDGAGATTALRAAAEASIDLTRRPWRLGAGARGAHVVVG